MGRQSFHGWLRQRYWRTSGDAEQPLPSAGKLRDVRRRAEQAARGGPEHGNGPPVLREAGQLSALKKGRLKSLGEQVLFFPEDFVCWKPWIE